ncbi:MAG: cell division protein ZapB [Candidatus Zixiibacteriota bacterium]|nr:MAG: cell division protein ZapB [candidate division Zixibacteria bacterium]
MDTLEKLEEKISKALTMIDRLKDENSTLKGENNQLKKELDEARSRLNEIERGESEKSEKIKGRLNTILSKLDALEQVPIS